MRGAVAMASEEPRLGGVQTGFLAYGTANATGGAAETHNGKAKQHVSYIVSGVRCCMSARFTLQPSRCHRSLVLSISLRRGQVPCAVDPRVSRGARTTCRR